VPSASRKAAVTTQRCQATKVRRTRTLSARHRATIAAVGEAALTPATDRGGGRRVVSRVRSFPGRDAVIQIDLLWHRNTIFCRQKGREKIANNRNTLGCPKHK